MCRYLKIEVQHYLLSLSSILPNLEEVTDYVHIHDCNGLVKNVAGFASLVKVGSYVTVHGNRNLEVLDNGLFPSLENITGSIAIHSNAKLTNMTNFLPSLVTSGGIVINNNGALASLDSTTGFANLATSTGQIAINGNGELLSINGVFPALTAVESSIEIHTNPKLHTVGPARFGASSSPMTMAGTFTVYDNYVLADVTGFQGLGCTAADKCIMDWYTNSPLEKADVCGVWDSMDGLKEGTGGTCTGGGQRPCYGGPSGYSGYAANC